MRRGEIWWARLPAPYGTRPVVLLSRDRAIEVRQLVIVGLLTRRIRGIASEVPLGPAEGLPKPCVANLDVLLTMDKNLLARKAGSLGPGKLSALNAALRFALGLE